MYIFLQSLFDIGIEFCCLFLYYLRNSPRIEYREIIENGESPGFLIIFLLFDVIPYGFMKFWELWNSL